MSAMWDEYELLFHQLNKMGRKRIKLQVSPIEENVCKITM